MEGYDGIGEYLVGITIASVIISLVSVLLPDTLSPSIKSSTTTALSFCLICAVLAPLSSVISKAVEDAERLEPELALPEISEGDLSGLYGSLEEESARAIEEALLSGLISEFGFSEKNVSLSAVVSADENGVELLRVVVYLSGSAIMANPREVKAYIGRFTDVECVIVSGRE